MLRDVHTVMIMHYKSHKDCIGRPCLLLFMICLLSLSGLPGLTASAQAPTPSDDDVNRIASQLYCPICDNLSLDVCPLEACRRWRELIREQLAEGWTEREIKDYFVAQYGEQVLGEPPRSGLNWLLYLLPPLIVVAGAAVLITNMKRPSRKSPDPAPASDDRLHLEDGCDRE